MKGWYVNEETGLRRWFDRTPRHGRWKRQPSRPGERLIAGAKEALAVAKGEQPAASITVNGHRYVPEFRLEAVRVEALEEAAKVAEGRFVKPLRTVIREAYKMPLEDSFGEVFGYIDGPPVYKLDYRGAIAAAIRALARPRQDEEPS